MDILTTEQIRRVDELTLEYENISSIQLMEQAAEQLAEWIADHYSTNHRFYILCGPGNNGGDGLALARLLHQKNYEVKPFLATISTSFRPDNQINQQRLEEMQLTLHPIDETKRFSNSLENVVFVDALFGSGLNRGITNEWRHFIDHINQLPNEVISVDIPSGLFAETPNRKEDAIIQASHTIAFEVPKLAFFLPQNELFVGQWHITPIGLSQRAIKEQKSTQHVIDDDLIRAIYRPRTMFSHKGDFGHSLLIGGCKGMIGAIQLATKAALRAGSGLVSAYVPQCAYTIMQIAAPEAMCLTDSHQKHISSLPKTSEFDAIGIGPGFGLHKDTKKAFTNWLSHCPANTKLVIDADGLNMLSQNKDGLATLPRNTILTPHPGEFRRLVGEWQHDYERLEKQQTLATKLQCIVILKGAYTSIALPSGELYFNHTGNPGMATGGSGDVLTGTITGLLSQGYDAKEAAIIGVYLHGLAGDFASKAKSQEALLANDIIGYLGKAFLQFK